MEEDIEKIKANGIVFENVLSKSFDNFGEMMLNIIDNPRWVEFKKQQEQEKLDEQLSSLEFDKSEVYSSPEEYLKHFEEDKRKLSIQE